MPEFTTFFCPSCGAKLKIDSDLDRFCTYCGNEFAIKRNGRTISIESAVRQLHNVQTGVDKTASELAIRRLQEEIDKLENKRDQIKGAGCLSSIFSGGGLTTLGVVSFLLAAVVSSFLHIEASNAVWSVVISAVIILVIAGVIDFNSEQEASNSRNSIQQDISEKQLELEKHRKIVSAK